MNKEQLIKLGIPRGEGVKLAQIGLGAAIRAGIDDRDSAVVLRTILETPGQFLDHQHFGALAHMLAAADSARARFIPRAAPAPWKQWGDGLEAGALDQMRNAVQLPVAVRGALMPDAHQGYGLPIGGVLATRNAVIPYAVGVDIACRMKMTVLDMPVEKIDKREALLTGAINAETRFGVGASFKQKRDHDVMDADWSVSPVTQALRDRAWSQLGTSGSGNHFVEFGELHVTRGDSSAQIGLEPGVYLALLSHSGSRGTGATVADHYSKLARAQHPELPKELTHLAWLDLESQAGQEYWAAMELMGKYAAANHELIHRHIAANLGVEVLLDVENHHNFAWRETHDGEELIVHRKGATPAGAGVLGLIPGSMGAPGYLVRGRGLAASLNSASHGAGRRMSRTAANAQFKWSEVKAFLDKRRVKLLSAGLDEAPMAYKDIDKVMAAQADLVETLARFEPRLVKMAPAGERPED